MLFLGVGVEAALMALPSPSAESSRRPEPPLILLLPRRLRLRRGLGHAQPRQALALSLPPPLPPWLRLGRHPRTGPPPHTCTAPCAGVEPPPPERWNEILCHHASLFTNLYVNHPTAAAFAGRKAHLSPQPKKTAALSREPRVKGKKIFFIFILPSFSKNK